MTRNDGERILVSELTQRAVCRFPRDSGRDDPWRVERIIASLAAGDRGFCLKKAGSPVGYALWRRLPDVMEVLNLAIFPLYRSRGYGRILLQFIENEARQSGSVGIWLEVRVDNQRATALYRSFGFNCVGKRRGYYSVSEPAEPADAILMEKRL